MSIDVILHPLEIPGKPYLKARAEVTCRGLWLDGFWVVRNDGKLRVLWPKKQVGPDWVETVQARSPELEAEIEEAVLEAFRLVFDSGEETPEEEVSPPESISRTIRHRREPL